MYYIYCFEENMKPFRHGQAHPVSGSLLGAVGLAVLPDPGQGSSKGRLQRELLVLASPHCHPQSVLAG